MGMLDGIFGQAGSGLSVYSESQNSMASPNAPSAGSEGLGQFVGSIAHTAASVAGGLLNSVFHAVGNAGMTLADIPSQAIHNAVSSVKELSARATGNEQAYLNAQAQNKAYENSSFIGKQYGQGNVQSLEHAGEFAGTMATLGAPFFKAAETGIPLADRLINGAGKFLGAGKGNLVTKSLRNTLLTQPTLQFAGKTAADVGKGDVKSAMLDAAMWGLPAMAGVAGKAIGAVASATGNALFGKAAILNDIFSPEVVSQYAKDHPEDLNTLKQIEQFTLNQKHVAGNVDLAAPWLKNYIESTIPGIGGDAKGLESLVQNFKPYSEELQKLQALQKAGKTVTNAYGVEVPASELTVSHNFVDNIPKVQQSIESAIGDPKWNEDLSWRVQQTKQAVGSLGIADETLNAQMTDAILNSNTAQEAQANLQDVMRVGQKQIVKDLGNGFVYTSAPKYVAHMPGAADVAGNELAQGQKGSLSGVGDLITKAGLSPRATADGNVQGTLMDNIDKRLEDLNVATTGKQLVQLLKDKASTSLGVSDLRMLSTKEIKEAVASNPELSQVPPKVLAGLIRGAYRDLPAELTGLGPKLTNAVMNPLLSGYLRAQGVGRFELNPFFRGVKVPLKGGIVAAAHGADVEDMTKAYLGLSKETQNALEADASGGWYLSSSRAGESGTTAENNVVGTGKQVGRAVQAQITGLVDSVAKAHGVTPQDIINEKGDLYNELQHSVGLIKGYGHGGYLNSPLAKTLNLVIFPSRFDTKVVQSAAKIMANMSPLQQVAVVHAGANMMGFLQSDQGHQWVQQNAEALQTLQYFSPMGTFQNAYNFFSNGQHAQDLGEFGGLPFGFITTMINHQVPSLGKLGSSQQYNLKTGAPYANAVPETAKARAQQALTDLISSMFSYPGQSVGLGSKTKTIQTAIPALKPSKNEVQYTYANGSTEGSPNAPRPIGAPQADIAGAGGNVTPSPASDLTPHPIAPVAATGSSGRARAKAPKTVPLSQQLPGSAAF